MAGHKKPGVVLSLNLRRRPCQFILKDVIQMRPWAM